MRMDGGDHRLVVVRRIAVAQQDDVLDRGGCAFQRLVGGVEVGCVAGWIAKRHAVDRALDGGLVLQRRERHDEPCAGAIGHADQVARGQLIDDRIGGAPQHLIAVAALRRFEDEHDRDRWLLHVLRDLDLDRQGGLDRGAGVSARAIAVRTADHDQAGAEVPHGCLQHRHRLGAEAGGRDVDQHDRLIRRQVRRRVGQVIGGDRRRADAGRAQRRLEALRLADGVLHQENAGRADHLNQRLAQVVLGVGIAYGIDHDAHRVKARIRWFHALPHRGLADRQVHRGGVEQVAIQIPADGHMGRAIGDDQRLRVGLLALRERPWRIKPIDVGLRTDGHREGDRIDSDALGPQQPRLGHRVAKVLPSVADHDQVLAAVIRQDRSAQLQRRREVRVVGVGLALELAELWSLADVDLDLGIPAEAEHAGPVLALALGKDAAHGGGLAVERALHAG